MASFVDSDGRGDCLPRGDKCGDTFPVYESRVDPIPRNEWRDAAEAIRGQESLVQKIKNQGREGSCASNAAAQAMEMLYVSQGGERHWVELSAISLYKRVGRNPDSGSTIDSNLRELKRVGILPRDNAANRNRFDHTMPPRGFYTNYPAGWELTAAKFRVLEWWDIQTFDGMISAMLRGYPIVYGRAGHAICGVRPVLRNGLWHIKYANSWGDWGDNGFGYDSELYVSGAIASYGAWSPRVTTELDDTLPKRVSK